jgi:hypothetical protein
MLVFNQGFSITVRGGARAWLFVMQLMQKKTPGLDGPGVIWALVPESNARGPIVPRQNL